MDQSQKRKANDAVITDISGISDILIRPAKKLCVVRHHQNCKFANRRADVAQLAPESSAQPTDPRNHTQSDIVTQCQSQLKLYGIHNISGSHVAHLLLHAGVLRRVVSTLRTWQPTPRATQECMECAVLLTNMLYFVKDDASTASLLGSRGVSSDTSSKHEHCDGGGPSTIAPSPAEGTSGGDGENEVAAVSDALAQHSDAPAQHSDALAQHRVASTTDARCAGPKHVARMSDAAPMLVHCMSNTSLQELSLQCCWACGNLAQNGLESRKKLAAAGAIDAIMKFLGRGLQQLDTVPYAEQSVRIAAWALGPLVQDQSIRLQQTFRKLKNLQILQVGLNTFVAGSVAWLLSDYAGRDQTNTSLLVKAGFVESVILAIAMAQNKRQHTLNNNYQLFQLINLRLDRVQNSGIVDNFDQADLEYSGDEIFSINLTNCDMQEKERNNNSQPLQQNNQLFDDLSLMFCLGLLLSGGKAANAAAIELGLDYSIEIVIQSQSALHRPQLVIWVLNNLLCGLGASYHSICIVLGYLLMYVTNGAVAGLISTMRLQGHVGQGKDREQVYSLMRSVLLCAQQCCLNYKQFSYQKSLHFFEQLSKSIATWDVQLARSDTNDAQTIYQCFGQSKQLLKQVLCTTSGTHQSNMRE